MRKIFFAIISLTAIMIVACGKKDGDSADEGKLTSELQLKGDKTIYGLACDGCTDSVVYLLPNDGSDPIKYDIIDAFRQHKVIGHLKVGDWIGVVLNPKDSTVADLVIDLDQLKGSWCYIVMPKMRDWDKLSKRQQARMEKNMPDSVKEQYLIPREYGFTLSRQFQASSIGYVPTATALEDESPVVYPTMAYYFEWHILNGQLILYRYAGDPPMMTKNKGNQKNQKKPEIVIDTCSVDFLSDDSLVLSGDGESRSYYRISNAADANKLAREKAQKLAKEALKNITTETTGSDGQKVKEAVKEAKK